VYPDKIWKLWSTGVAAA
jgi:hypothetical protein